MRKDQSHILECSCLGVCTLVRFHAWECDELAISFYADVFYTKQTSLIRKVWGRIKLAYYALAGKEYRLHEVFLTEDKAKDFLEFCQDQLENRNASLTNACTKDPAAPEGKQADFTDMLTNQTASEPETPGL